MKILVKYWVCWLPTMFAMVTMILAHSHYQMIGDASEYRDSALVGYEFIFLLCALVSLVGVGFAFVVCLVTSCPRSRKSLNRKGIGAIVTPVLASIDVC